jgi:hypothetical protein
MPIWEMAKRTIVQIVQIFGLFLELGLIAVSIWAELFACMTIYVFTGAAGEAAYQIG